MIDIRTIVDAIDAIEAEHGRPIHLQFSTSDARVDWRELGACTDGGLPALDYGQHDDCRWPLGDGRSLHAHWHPQVVRFHIDRFDPEEQPVEHMVRETAVVPGALAGALGGVALFRHPLGALLGAVVGGAGSTLFQRAQADVWVLEHQDVWTGKWQARPLSAGEAQAALQTG